MNRRQGLVALAAMVARAAALALAGAAGAAAAQTPAAAAAPQPDIRQIGPERYQVGRIVVDRRARTFSVPGRVLVVDQPLEYIATSPRGMKDYETLFELETSGTEFNLACILIGLEPDPKPVDWREFRSAKRLIGPKVTVDVAWTAADGKRRTASAAEALLNPEAGVRPETVEWVYIGSPASAAAGQFAAETTGTLIGFSHDSNSIIEAAVAIGLGAYGTVRGNALLPPIGTPIELTVKAVEAR